MKGVLGAIGFFIFITGCVFISNERQRKPLLPFYLNASPKDLAQYNYYEQRHAFSGNWREIEERNRQNKLKSVQDTFLGSWYELGSINQAGRIHTVDFDELENSIYAASSGGHIWKLNLSNNEWSVVNDFRRIDKMVFLKVVNLGAEKYVFAASGTLGSSVFYYSRDSGVNFNRAEGLEALAFSGYIKKAVYTEMNNLPVFYLLAETQLNSTVQTEIFLSKDTGRTFRSIWADLSPAGNWDITGGKLNKGEVVLGGRSKVTIIDTAGVENLLGNVQLQRLGNVLVSAYRTENFVVPYLAVYNETTTDFYAKDFSGWILKSYINDVPFMVNSFCVSMSHSNTLYFGGVNSFISEDGGLSWTKVSDWSDYYGQEETKFHADIPAIMSFIHNSQEFNIIATDGGIYMADYGLKNITNLSLENLNISQYYSVLSSGIDSRKILAGSQDQGLQLSDSLQLKSLNRFNQVLSGDYGHLVSADNSEHYWVVYPGFAAYSENLDVRYNWQNTSALWLPPAAQSYSKPECAYLAGTDQDGNARLYQLCFNGKSIESSMLSFSFSSNTNEQIGAIQVSPFDDKYLYVLTTQGRFFYSFDGGESWQQTKNFTGPKSHYFYGSDIACSKLQAGNIFISGSAYEQGLYPVYLSQDTGKTFAQLGTDLPPTLINAVALNNDENILFAAGEAGAYAYFFNDSAWINISDSAAPDVPYWDVEFVPQINTARFATYGRGIWDYVLRSDIQQFPPVLKKIIPDILVNNLDTSFSIELDSFFVASDNNSLIYSAYIQDTALADIGLINNKELVINPKSKGISKISVTAYNISGLRRSDNFYLNTDYSNEIHIYEKDPILLYPNPVRSVLHIAGLDINSVYEVQIINLSGLVVARFRILHQNDYSLDCNFIPHGTYLLKISNAKTQQIQTIKWVKR